MDDGKLYLAVCVRRGFLGDWPLALVVKFLLTPTSENHAHSFYSPPFDSRVSHCQVAVGYRPCITRNTIADCPHRFHLFSRVGCEH